jgi:hypothetical protein
VAIIVSLLVGAVATLITVKVTNVSTETFTASELITFIFGAVLSAASIVLAISAISLGRLSEQAMIERSDESIKLQNEIYAMTTDALGRIESSTGVTEKRIEDIISGRAGAISDRIVDRLIEDRSVRTRSRKKLERNVRESLLQGLQKTEFEIPATKEEKEFDAFVKRVLQFFASLPQVTARKLGEGDMSGEGEALVDGVFEIDKQRLAVTVLTTHEAINPLDRDEMIAYLADLTKGVLDGIFDKVFVVFDDVLRKGSDHERAIETFRSMFKDDLISKYAFVSAEPSELESELGELTRQMQK